MNSLYIILAIILIEIIIRFFCKFFSIIPSDIRQINFNKWLKIDRDLLFIPQPYYKGNIDSTPVVLNNLGLRDSHISLKKEGEKRILCIGDSVVFGKDLPLEHTFPKVLEQELKAKFKSNIFVVNAGISGYSTYQWLIFLKKYFNLLCPDIIIVALNINDRRMIKEKWQTDNPDYFNQYHKKHMRLFFIRMLNHSYFYLILKSLGKKIFKRFNNLRYNREIKDLAPRVPETKYRDNLEEILQFAYSHNLKAVFVNLGDAIQRVRLLYEGIDLAEKGNYQSAISKIEKVAESDLRCFKPLAHYELSKIYQAQADLDNARQEKKKAFEEARFEIEVMSGPPIRLDRAYQAVMRNVALQNKVPIIEAAEYFAQKPSHYRDFCHLDAEGHRWLAEVLYSQIIEKGLIE
jgi:lysophospholipase L1-like esterase